MVPEMAYICIIFHLKCCQKIWNRLWGEKKSGNFFCPQKELDLLFRSDGFLIGDYTSGISGTVKSHVNPLGFGDWVTMQAIIVF